MKITSHSAVLTLLVLSALIPNMVLAHATELETISNPAAGFVIDLPEGWRVLSLATGLIGSSPERNNGGRPVVSFNVSQPDLAGKSFVALREEQQASAKRRSKPGDLIAVVDLEHAAGPAFRLTRRTTTKDGLEQVIHAVYIEAGSTVWLLNWSVAPTDNPDRFEELSIEVVASFRAD